ncbi:MAG: DUF1553 domain-containing protein, partial [Planctomycetota bacterium]
MREADGSKTPLNFAVSIPDVPYLPHDPDTVIQANGKNFAAWTKMNYARNIVLIPETPIPADAESVTLEITCKEFLLASFPLVIRNATVEFTDAPELAALASDRTFSDLKQRLAETRSTRDAIKSVAIPTTRERPDHLARPTHVFARGNFMEKDVAVRTGFPASLASESDPTNPTRLDMAKWWVAEDHPLTARVLVNRLWEQLFGTGLVATLEDFGSSGEKPSHPELLDFLAHRFQHTHGWSVKETLRDIVLSETYRQSSKVSPELLARDPSNRFLARGPRHRLSAEVIRDQSLAIGGLLHHEVGGEPVHPPIPKGVWKPFEKGDKWKTPEAGESDRYRRALYTYTKRSIPFPAFATFDAPSREFCNPRRLTSNTPLQALTMLNDEAYAEAAKGLARRMKSEADKPIGEKIATGYRIA